MVIVSCQNIVDVTADAIVKAANTELIHGGGVARAISEAAGEELVAESRKIGLCELGSAVATTAGRLNAKCVIHVPTIDYFHGSIVADVSQIEHGLRKAFRLAVECGCKSIALPLLGAGIAGLDESAVARTIASVARDYPTFRITVTILNKKQYERVKGYFDSAAESAST